ncbi:MAG: undecaprenyl/decaprenyl-phosphate alpha-N-acetylglucosaminyl 1-phosphate transferase [Candidatus Aureabacteria bacterium]|nr:undecaprenyl/decaprenyl-phosphate alpha-N-acetylglucosaminyl 1-phosphate transferase [Candidatus Auribacterota bacterium]
MSFKVFLFVFSISIGVAALFTPFIIKLSCAFKVYDKPGHRKVHQRNMPTMGGLSMVLGFFAALVVSEIYFPNAIENFHDKFLGIIISSVILIALGVIDDIKGLNAKFKICVQLLVAVILIVSGFCIEEITNPFGDKIFLGVFGYILTALWIVGVINAINFLDGLDGLACGVAGIISFFLFLSSLKQGNTTAAVISLALCGCCFGFLPYNFNPAKIFMGNTGSMFLGFILAIIAVTGYSKTQTLITLIIPVIALGLPIIDTGLAILRRIARGRHIFHADKEHIHHHMLTERKSQRKVVLSMYFLSCCFGMISLSFTGFKGIFAVIALVLVIMVTIDWIRKSGFLNFR